jgi:hypothetical protein
MLRRKQRIFTMKKTNSIVSDLTAATTDDLSVNISTLTSKYLYDVDEELSVSRICAAQRKKK